MCKFNPETGELHMTKDEAEKMEGNKYIVAKNGDDKKPPRIFGEDLVWHTQTVVVLATVLISAVTGWVVNDVMLKHRINRVRVDPWAGAMEAEVWHQFEEDNPQLGIIVPGLSDIRDIQKKVPPEEVK